MAIIKTVIRNKDGIKRPTREFSSRQEKTVTKTLGGIQQKNSGATLFAKGDVLLDKWMLECKTKMTPSESITIKKEWFEKNIKETLLTGKPYSAIVFNFGPDEENHYIIDEELFIKLCEVLDNERNK